MSFSTFGLGWVLGGLAVLAAALFALQRLRVRHQDVTVPTTLFWREAVEEARARVLVQRFRHPWVYAFLLLIAGLMWLAAAGPRWDSDDGVDHVVLLDGSAGMARDGRFDAAVQALRAALEELPADRRTVRFCGGTPRTVLLPGEHAELLWVRLEELAPEPCPATLDGELRHLLATERARALSVLCVGDARIPAESLAALPAEVSVRHVLPSGSIARNHGIIAIGVDEAASGAYATCDVLVTVAGSDAVPSPILQLAGANVDTRAEVRDATAGARTFVFRDLPAKGESLRVAISGDDGLRLDDSAVLRLPLRQPVRVEIAADSPERLRSILDFDPAVTVVADGADVAFRRGDTTAENSTAGDPRPALEWVPMSAQQHAITIVHGGVRPSAEVLRHAVDALGIGEIDAMEWAEVAQRPITLGVVEGSGPRVRIWEELLTERFDFTSSRAFPLFVARAVRWLAGEEPWIPFASAGEATVLAGGAGVPGRWRDAAGTELDPVGAGFSPPRAGAYASGERGLGVALTDPAATLGPEGVEPLDADQDAASSAAPDGLTLLALLAFGLLLVEWFLYRSGRMP